MVEIAKRALVMLSLMVGVSSIATPVAAGDVTASLVSVGSTPDLILVYTGDVIGYIDPCG
jgi:hypothetical protein